jgi:hypothetical protein
MALSKEKGLADLMVLQNFPTLYHIRKGFVSNDFLPVWSSAHTTFPAAFSWMLSIWKKRGKRISISTQTSIPFLLHFLLPTVCLDSTPLPLPLLLFWAYHIDNPDFSLGLARLPDPFWHLATCFLPAAIGQSTSTPKHPLMTSSMIMGIDTTNKSLRTLCSVPFLGPI